MITSIVVLPERVKREAKHLLAQLDEAPSVVLAVHVATKAEGFVLALAAAEVMQADDARNLEMIFETAFQKRMNELMVT